jgi:hypothetical protein
MSRFIKLSTKIVNVSYIQKIIKEENKYYICLQANDIDGFFMFAGGWMSSKPNEIQVCKKRHPDDYEIVKKWVEEL